MDLDRGRLTMSRGGEISRDFAGERRTFRLGIGEWRKVQEKCDAGPGELAARLAGFMLMGEAKMAPVQIAALGRLGSWRIDDVREVIFQGLIGGGMKPNEALELVRAWVDERPWSENVPTAYEVVMASILGAEDEEAAGE